MKNIQLNYVTLLLITITASSTIMSMNLRKSFNQGIHSTNSAFNNASNVVTNSLTDAANSATSSVASVTDNASNTASNTIVTPIAHSVVQPTQDLALSVAQHGKEAIDITGDIFDKTGQIIKALPSIIRSLSDIMKELQDMINAGMVSAKATSAAINPIAQEMSTSIGKLQETIAHLM